MCIHSSFLSRSLSQLLEFNPLSVALSLLPRSFCTHTDKAMAPILPSPKMSASHVSPFETLLTSIYLASSLLVLLLLHIGKSSFFFFSFFLLQEAFKHATLDRTTETDRNT